MASLSSTTSGLMKELVRQAREEGSLDMMLAQLTAEHGEGFELLPEASSMTDASKRRMTSQPEKESVISGADGAKEVSGSPFSFEKKLPSGIRDLEHWGKTILQVGKYERAGLSYDQISTSDRKEHISYCAWMLAQKYRMDLTVQVRDFVRYLNVKSLSEQSEEVFFEDSTVRRKMRA